MKGSNVCDCGRTAVKGTRSDGWICDRCLALDKARAKHERAQKYKALQKPTGRCTKRHHSVVEHSARITMREDL